MSLSKAEREVRQFYVYVLRCPNTMLAKYVGISSDPDKRAKAHWKNLNLGTIKKRDWLLQLRAASQRFVLDVLIGPVSYEQAKHCERWLIFNHRKRYPDQNVNGSGIQNPDTETGCIIRRLQSRIAVLESENAQLRAQSPAPLLNATA